MTSGQTGSARLGLGPGNLNLNRHYMCAHPPRAGPGPGLYYGFSGRVFESGASGAGHPDRGPVGQGPGAGRAVGAARLYCWPARAEGCQPAWTARGGSGASAGPPGAGRSSSSRIMKWSVTALRLRPGSRCGRGGLAARCRLAARPRGTVGRVLLPAADPPRLSHPRLCFNLKFQVSGMAVMGLWPSRPARLQWLPSQSWKAAWRVGLGWQPEVGPGGPRGLVIEVKVLNQYVIIKLNA